MEPDNDQETLVYDIREKPFGRTWAEWTASWWQWILSIPKESNPGTGHDPSTNQHDENVFFLAGSFGGFAERHIVVPAGKALLFPIINFTTSFAEDPRLKSEGDLVTEAKNDIDDIVQKEVTIEGKSIRPFQACRVSSGIFTVNYPPNNVFNARPGFTKGISDGYWLFLHPLHSGNYKVHTLGACSSGRTRVDVLYHLTVE